MSVPSPDELLALPIDVVGMHLLWHLIETRNKQHHRNNLQTELPKEYGEAKAARALAEAWDWLCFQGWLANELGSDGWCYVTDRGLDASKDERAIERLRAGTRLNIELHPLIEGRVRNQFLLGEYEAAVLLAFREAEILCAKWPALMSPLSACR